MSMKESTLKKQKDGRVVRFVLWLCQWLVVAMSRDINSLVGLICLSPASQLV